MPIRPANHPTPPTASASPLAALAIALATLPLSSQAQETPDTTQPKQLSKLVVTDTEDAIKVEQAASPKFTQPLLDTPQTITVVTAEVLQQQGAGTLMQALANTPGITLQLGENGNTSAGDTFFMRGISSESSIFSDGIRDSGATTRDTFNTQQVEIAKGPAGSDYGRGATSGYINQVSKLPMADDFGNASMTYSTANNLRTTADVNRALSDQSALRLNVLWQNGGVAGRDTVENNRWGVAPAVGFGLLGHTRLYLYSQHVRQDNIPDGGIPTIGLNGFYHAAFASGGTNAGVTPARVDTSTYYGHADDYETMTSDSGTLQLEHEFSTSTVLRNTTRYSKNTLERIVTSVIGAGSTGYVLSSTDPGYWAIALSRQGTARDNTTTSNQTNLTTRFNWLGLDHALASGAEYIKETQYSPTFYTNIGTLTGVRTSATATTPTANTTYIYHPDPEMSYSAAPNLTPNGAYTRGFTQTLALYANESASIGQHWLITANIRAEKYNTDYNAMSSALVLSQYNGKGSLLSWRAGATFKPVSHGSIYLTYANSLTPPGSANFQLSAENSASSNNPNADPQEATNIEVGTKWELLQQRLNLNLALYRSEKKNEIVTVDSTTGELGQYGKSRVEGIEVSAVGNLGNRWQLSGGAAYLKTKVIEGTTTTTGQTTRWTPPFSATVWSTYLLTPKLRLGGGANYVDTQKRDLSLTTSSTSVMSSIPSYWVANAMASYAVNSGLSVQLNVYNLFDEDYIARLNNSGYRYTPGEPRNAQLSVNFQF